MVNADNPFDLDVSVGVDVVKVVQKVAAREGDEQIGVPWCKEEKICEQVIESEAKNEYYPDGTEDWVNEADLEIAVWPWWEFHLFVLIF